MKSKNKVEYEKSYYILSEDDAYEIEAMVSTFICAFWEILEKRSLNHSDRSGARKTLYDLFKKHIGRLC